MLCTISGVQQKFSCWLRVSIIWWIEKQLAQSSSQGSTSWFSRHNQLRSVWHQSTLGEPTGKLLKLCGLATTVNAFQHQQSPLPADHD
jgi:hypothetical protein